MHDKAMQEILNVVELPDRLAQDFIMFTLNNQGELPNRRRKKMFKDLTDKEVSLLEVIIKEEFEGSDKD